MPELTSQSRTKLFVTFLTGVYVLSVIILVYLLVRGGSFYATFFSQRVYSEDYRIWRSAGSMGHAFGMVGSVMMVLMLVHIGVAIWLGYTWIF